MSKREILVYFSATGSTAQVAERIAQLRGIEAIPLVPAEPYTVADLNWGSKDSRSSHEMADEACRPAINPLDCNLSDYDVVFVGYPIWWGIEPRVIDSFLESHDFSGTIIVPFATSGGSGIGSSPARIQALTPGSTVRSARLLSAAVPVETLEAWLDGMRFE